ncbi:MAG: MBL fold metallo-hydrolase [Magnetococcales bacterium]|nr:MBL fold metallo-hydrolase [Magnetococcales bacterium]
MNSIINQNINTDRPVQLADGVFWVGANHHENLPANPYLIVDGDEAVLIDGGSRPDFSTVMRKVLQTGIAPEQIRHLIYQHYDPDLCGSIPNLEQLIDREDLQIISKKENNPFIRHYSVRSKLMCIDGLGHELILKSGRRLRFLPTPYAHSAGSFITLDETSGILFTSDLFGTISRPRGQSLFAEMHELCLSCRGSRPEQPHEECPKIQDICLHTGVHLFHKEVMPSTKALRHALSVIFSVDARMIAPQHGVIFHRREDIQTMRDILESLEDIGIDHIPGVAK